MAHFIKTLCCALALALIPSPAGAGNFGCRVLLCIAAPVLPAQCAATVKKLRKRLAKGKSFPKCKMVDADGSEKAAGTYGKEVAPCSEAYGPEYFERMVGKESNRPVCSKKLEAPVVGLDGARYYEDRPRKLRYFIDIQGVGRRYFYP